MSKKSAAKRVETVAEDTALATVQEAALPVSLDEMQADAGMGLEGIGADDQAIPFLTPLQALSPQCQKRTDAYVEGAEPGAFYQSVTGELFDGAEGVLLVPVAYQRRIIEWKPREVGGGFVAAHDPGSNIMDRAVRNEKGKDVLPNGNIVEPTAHHYCLLLKEDGTFEQVLITMKSTQLKKSRKWNSMMLAQKARAKDGSLFTPASYAYVYQATTVAESNDQGSWFGWSISLVGPLTDPNVYRAAREFAQAIRSGNVKVKHEADDIDDSIAAAAESAFG